MILECINCLRDCEWDKDECPEGPGPCFCGTRISAPWRVIKERRPAGFVRRLDKDGWKELKPPYYR